MCGVGFAPLGAGEYEKETSDGLASASIGEICAFRSHAALIADSPDRAKSFVAIGLAYLQECPDKRV